MIGTREDAPLMLGTIRGVAVAVAICVCDRCRWPSVAGDGSYRTRLLDLLENKAFDPCSCSRGGCLRVLVGCSTDPLKIGQGVPDFLHRGIGEIGQTGQPRDVELTSGF